MTNSPVLVCADTGPTDTEKGIHRHGMKNPIEDGTNTIFMTFGEDLVVSEEAADSITRALKADSDHDRPIIRRY